MRPTDWLKRLDEPSPRVAVALGCGVGLGFLLLPGTVLGAVLGLLGMGGLFALGMSGRMLLVSVPRRLKNSLGSVNVQPSLMSRAKHEEQEWTFADGVSLVMKPLAGGTFWMGTQSQDPWAEENEMPCHLVTLSPLWIMSVGVTVRLYLMVTRQAVVVGPDADWPMTSTTWFEAVSFCNELSLQLGFRPCYQKSADGWHWDRSADGFRLPTEAEREYATRAGTDTAWCGGIDSTELGDHAWFGEDPGGDPHPVGARRANQWGLHDMHGNVLEWCWDYYGTYANEHVTDPSGPLTGKQRVLRGGTIGDGPGKLRSAYRRFGEPALQGRLIGFRCVRSVSHPT